MRARCTRKKRVSSSRLTSRLGFGHLNPKFGIRSAGSDTTRLPSASSCFNLLKMPEYKVSAAVCPLCCTVVLARGNTCEQQKLTDKDEKTLKAKLLQAITSGAGFDLS